jgi:F-type H+-transporting ATPase subunit b
VISLNITLLIQIALFLSFMFLLNQLLFKPMVRVLDERRERTEGRRKKAAQLDGEAESVLADYLKRIQDARADADRTRDQLARQGEAERQKIVEAAMVQAEKTVAEVRGRVRAEALEARKALEAEARALAEGVAEKILGRAM